MSETQDLLLHAADGVLLITLNRPDRLNALSDEMVDGLAAALAGAAEDESVRAVVITGAGRGFCSGRDVQRAAGASEQNEPRSAADLRYNLRHIHHIAHAALRLDKPYLAAVNGAAAGAGMDLASMADIRFASSEAKFTQAYSRNAIVPGNGGCFFLPRIVGMAKALELLWTSRKFDAQEGLEMGYVSRVIDAPQLVAQTMDFARELAAGPPISIQSIKQLCYQSQQLDLASSLRLAQQMQAIAMSSQDAKEGLAALRDKRPPNFIGR